MNGAAFSTLLKSQTHRSWCRCRDWDISEVPQYPTHRLQVSPGLCKPSENYRMMTQFLNPSPFFEGYWLFQNGNSNGIKTHSRSWYTPKYRSVTFWVFILSYNSNKKTWLHCKLTHHLPTLQQFHTERWQSSTTEVHDALGRKKPVVVWGLRRNSLFTNRMPSERGDPWHFAIFLSKLLCAFLSEPCRRAGWFLSEPFQLKQFLWGHLNCPARAQHTLRTTRQRVCVSNTHTPQHSFFCPLAPAFRKN